MSALPLGPFAIALLSLFFVSASTSADADGIDKYFTGELEHLYVIKGNVNIHDTLLSTSFDANGKRLERLSEKKGKVLLVTLWREGCLRCKMHMQQLAKAQEHYGKNTLEVIAINLDLKPNAHVRRYMDRKGLENLTAYQDYTRNFLSRISVDPDLRFTGRGPITLIVDPAGQVRATASSGRNWLSPEAEALIGALADAHT